MEPIAAAGRLGHVTAPAPVVVAEPYTDLVAEVTPLGFEDFYRSARPGMARALAFALGDADLAAEATDEAMTRAYERWHTVSTLDRPEAWVFRVGMNWALSILRRRRRKVHKLYESGVVDAPSVSDPAVHAALGSLDPKHRSVVVCRHLLGWSVAEVAAALQIREGTVKSRLHRATRALQSQLHHLDPEEQQ
jgi:RNA polymerase sigma factor (sigma-70 family)